LSHDREEEKFSETVTDNIHIGAFALNAEMMNRASQNHKNLLVRQATLDLGVTAEVEEPERPDSQNVRHVPHLNIVEATTSTKNEPSSGRKEGIRSPKELANLARAKNSEHIQQYYKQKQNMKIQVERPNQFESLTSLKANKE